MKTLKVFLSYKIQKLKATKTKYKNEYFKEVSILFI